MAAVSQPTPLHSIFTPPAQTSPTFRPNLSADMFPTVPTGKSVSPKASTTPSSSTEFSNLFNNKVTLHPNTSPVVQQVPHTQVNYMLRILISRSIFRSLQRQVMILLMFQHHYLLICLIFNFLCSNLVNQVLQHQTLYRLQYLLPYLQLHLLPYRPQSHLPRQSNLQGVRHLQYRHHPNQRLNLK